MANEREREGTHRGNEPTDGTEQQTQSFSLTLSPSTIDILQSAFLAMAMGRGAISHSLGPTPIDLNVHDIAISLLARANRALVTIDETSQQAPFDISESEMDILNTRLLLLGELVGGEIEILSCLLLWK